MIVSLPWPDKRLTPNAKRRKHWSFYQPVAAKARVDATYATFAALSGGLRELRSHLAGDFPIPLTVTFVPPDRRHRDDDGMIGAFKHARDGIADALAVDDRRFRPQYAFNEPKFPGSVEVEIEVFHNQKQPHSLARCADTDTKEDRPQQEAV